VVVRWAEIKDLDYLAGKSLSQQAKLAEATCTGRGGGLSPFSCSSQCSWVNRKVLTNTSIKEALSTFLSCTFFSTVFFLFPFFQNAFGLLESLSTTDRVNH
jgi:hypothetical protein